MYIYPTNRTQSVMETQPVIQNILGRQKVEPFYCPYDKLVLAADSCPDSSFIRLIRPARIWIDDDDFYYRHKFLHTLFSVCWGQMNPDAATTSIMINPWKHQLTPDDIMQLVELVMGSIHSVKIASFDEKTDLLRSMNAEETAKRLYVGYQRKPPEDYEQLGQTYYYGSRSGQQVKNYDKAEEQGKHDQTWTRIERTRRIRDKVSRATLKDFLYNERQDAFKHTVLVDIDKIDGRTKIQRLLKATGSFQEAFMNLDAAEKRKLKRHEIFACPSVDLGSLFRTELDRWMSLSPKLYSVFKTYALFRECWSGKSGYGQLDHQLDWSNLQSGTATLTTSQRVVMDSYSGKWNYGSYGNSFSCIPCIEQS
ncbi:hypothetical protein AWM70_19425 [Paenibacillus yonginensis]|uniref:Uncharacterized protein n=1 Tax=Paenibacillus yonginensis TaxID=1462996 RepID=A0A1B1N4Z0_9BACL|nr:hypothetical protein [Paenibacillus yonginensis]ANS76476.1 hypothetical protein AWM70_19425 [Paenibacillus yonginensis]